MLGFRSATRYDSDSCKVYDGQGVRIARICADGECKEDRKADRFGRRPLFQLSLCPRSVMNEGVS